MSYHRNKSGQIFSSGIGGNYPINNGDPQNNDDEFDPEAFDEQENERADYLLARREERECE
jgi:hypothetical protein